MVAWLMRRSAPPPAAAAAVDNNQPTSKSMPIKAPKRIGDRKKHAQAYPLYKKRGRPCHQKLLITPPSKSRRCNSGSGLPPALMYMSNTSNDVNDMKQLLQEMSVDLGHDTTASYVLSNVAALLKLAFGDDEDALCLAIDTLSKEHLGLHSNMSPPPVTPVNGNTNQPTQVAMLSVPKIVEKTVVPVSYNPNIFQLSPLNSNLPPLRGSHGRVNLHRFKAKLVETLKECGSMEHQLFLLHKVLTQGELAGIGLGLGLLRSPDVRERAMNQTMSNIDQLLRSTLVFGSHSNDSIAFQKTVFLLLAPTAPSEDAPANEHVMFKDIIDTQATFFELSKKQKQWLQQMVNIRRNMLNGVNADFKLMQSYKRKSDSMVNDNNKAIVKTWIENGCTKTIPSPNQRDTVVIKNNAGEVVSQE